MELATMCEICCLSGLLNVSVPDTKFMEINQIMQQIKEMAKNRIKCFLV